MQKTLIKIWLCVADTVTGAICPEGAYCPVGSYDPTPCANGTYMNHTGADVCYDCPPGYYCVNFDRADPCPQGYYCPEKTGPDYIPCPPGESVILFTLTSLIVLSLK